MARADSTDIITASVSGAHAHLIERIVTNKPHHLPGYLIADAADFEARAEHVRKLWIAVTDYTRTVLHDLDEKANVHLDLKYIEGQLSDLASDMVGQMEFNAETLRGVAA